MFILFIDFVAINTTTTACKSIFSDKYFAHSLSDCYTIAIQLGILSRICATIA